MGSDTPLASKSILVEDYSSAIGGITPAFNIATEKLPTADEADSSSNHDKEIKVRNAQSRRGSKNRGGDGKDRGGIGAVDIAAGKHMVYVSPRGMENFDPNRLGGGGDDVDCEWSGGGKTTPGIPSSRAVADEMELEQERPQAKYGSCSDTAGFSRTGEEDTPGFGHHFIQRAVVSSGLAVPFRTSVARWAHPPADGDAISLSTRASSSTAFKPSAGAVASVTAGKPDAKGPGGRRKLPAGHDFFPSEQCVCSRQDSEGSTKVMVGGGPEPLPFPWRDMLLSPAAWAVVAGNVGAGTAINILMNWLPLYYQALVHVDLEDIGLVAQVMLAWNFARVWSVG